MSSSNLILEKKFITTNSLITSGTAIFNPILYIFLISQGFSFTEVGIYLAVFWGATTIAELPTGIFADLVGQKKAAIISSVLRAISLLLLLSNSFILIILSAIFAGVAESLISGTLSSWLMNQSKDKESLNLDKIFSKAAYYGSILSLIIGFISAQYLYQFNNNLPIIFSGIFFLIVSIFIYIFLPENRITNENSTETEESNSILSTFNNVLSLFKDKKYLIVLLLLLVIPSILDIGPSNQWQVAFNDSGFLVGYLWVLISIVGIVTNILIPRLPKLKSVKRELIFYLLLDILMIFLIIYTQYHVLFFLLHISMITILSLKISVFIHKDLVKNDRIRSTFLSLFYTIESLLVTLLLPLNGYLSGSVGIFPTWKVFTIISILILLLLGFILLLMKKSLYHNSELSPKR